MNSCDKSQTLRITEIFCSIQGESASIGFPTVFVRLTGCPLRCVYCDSAYAFYGGKRISISDIVTEVASHQIPRVTITGGEPLAQPAVHALMAALLEQDFELSLETSGALPIVAVDRRVRIILDLKTPSSGEMLRNDYENIDWLKPVDEVKFVVGTKEDYLWAKRITEHYQLNQRASVIISPIYKTLDYFKLAEWILADKLNVRMQVQLHKVIWGDVAGK